MSSTSIDPKLVMHGVPVTTDLVSTWAKYCGSVFTWWCQRYLVLKSWSMGRKMGADGDLQSSLRSGFRDNLEGRSRLRLGERSPVAGERGSVRRGPGRCTSGRGQAPRGMAKEGGSRHLQNIHLNLISCFNGDMNERYIGCCIQ